MTSGQNSQVLILLGITLLLAVLFEWAWMMVHFHLRDRRRAGGIPAVEDGLPKEGPFPAVDRWFRVWNQKKDAWQNQWQTPLHIIRGMILFAILILAAIPSFLVVQDRWLTLENVRAPLTEFRCKLPLLCSLQLPPYFLFIAVCLLAAGLLIAFFPLGREVFLRLRVRFESADDGLPASQIKISRVFLWGSLMGFFTLAVLCIVAQKKPGWELAVVAALYLAGWLLRDYSFARVWHYLRDNPDWLAPSLLFHIALLASLAVYFSAPKYVLAPLAGLTVAAVLLFRVRRRVPPIYWIFSLGLAVFSININSWWVSVAGDEYGFYISARNILENTGIATVASRLFDEMGVYGQNSYLASIVQSVFMRVFGTQSFGWRFSNIYLAALSIPFFYFFFKQFLTRRVALGACFFLTVSEYLIDFSKIGYISLQALFALSVSLAAAAWAVRSGRAAAFAATGAILAMNFYSYGIAILAIPLAGLLLLWYAPPFTRAVWRRWGILAGGFGMLVFPLVFQPAFWKTGFGFTVFGSFGKNPPAGDIVQVFFNRAATSVFSYLYSPNESHFVAVSFVDWMTAIMVGIGFFVILFQLRRTRFSVYFLAGWAILLTIAGVLGSPDLPSTTRMFVVLPWWAAAAALGMQWILERIPADTPLGRRTGGIILGVLLLAVTGVNLFQATAVSRARWVDRLPFEAHVQRLAETTRNRASAAPSQFVFLTYSEWSLDPFLLFQKIYPQAWSGINPRKVVVDGPFLPEASLPYVSDSRSIILVVPTLAKPWQAELRVSLLALGEHWCPVYTSNGKWIYDLYVPDGMEWVCPAAEG